MIKKYLFALAIFPVLNFAQAPAGYYSGTEGLSGYALKTKLHEIISTKTYNWNYGDLPAFYAQTDIDKYYENDGTILDIYSEIPDGPDAYNYTTANIIGSANAEGLGWNREHGMPQSSFNSNYPMYSDLFFVIPTDARINQLRSNYPYGIVASASYTFTNGSKQGTNGIPGSTYKERAYEPINEFKGDVARMLLYFAVRYESKLGNFNYNSSPDPTKDRNPLNGTQEKAYEDWYIAMLLNWHQQDPVSQREIDRNNAVYNIQKNRNPFVDHPEWVNLIWNQTPDNVAPSAPSQLVLARNSAYFVHLNWQTSPESDVLGYKIYQDGILIGSTKSNTFYADHLSPNTTYNFAVKSYDSGYLESPESNTLSVTTLENDIFAKDLQITKYLEGSGNNKAIEIANKTGHPVDLNRYRLYAQFKGTNYYFSEAFEMENTIANNEAMVIINPNANFSCFNTPDAKFVTAAPGLTFSGSQYVQLSYGSTTVDGVGFKDMDNSNANKSLYRKTSVLNPNVTYDPAEWDVFGSDYCQNLGSLAVQDVFRNSHFSVYPNPVADQLNINGDMSKAKSLQIFDTSGKLIKDIRNPSNQNIIDVRTLSPNIYIMKIDDRSVKFIKK